jgi:hypothetical protein
MVTLVAQRQAVTLQLKLLKSSRRRESAVIGADRTSVRHRSVRPDNVAIRARLPELAILDDGFTYESIGRRAIYNGLNPVTIER